MSEELKPCPFHKYPSQVSVEETPIGGKWFVGCGACGASSGHYKSKKKAIETWNTRTPDPIIAELKEALETLLEQVNYSCGRVIPAGSFALGKSKAKQALAKLKEREDG